MQLFNKTNEAGNALRDFIEKHPRLVVLTGAGISTDSGIPDYRDQQGEWKRKQPVQHHAFITDEATRQRFWARSLIGWPIMRDAEPNQAHQYLAHLEQQGFIELLITQNVDGLHQKAGHKNVIDLHGRSDRVVCLDCSTILSRNETHNMMMDHNPSFMHFEASPAPDGDADLEDVDFSQFQVSECPSCGGTLKPDVVFFGDNVPKSTVAETLKTLSRADALLVIGSSLMVYSGYRFCKRAYEWKLPIAALNLGRTRADELLTLKLNTSINGTLKHLLNSAPKM